MTSAVSSERAPYYVNILYALVLMRRGHELAPRHEDLYARVLPAQSGLGPYAAEPFASDLEQLIAWDAVERVTEAKRLRGYKDNRRVQYRYRITGDAAALIDWLEARLAAKLEGRVGDGRDLLADVVGMLKEAKRLFDGWRKGTGGAEEARRAYYLVASTADAIGAISDELLAFRGEMLLFAQRPYDVDALREILAWLERYVEVYLGRVRELGDDIRDRVALLSAPRYRGALAACREEVERERREAPRMVRMSGAARDADELLGSAARFFRGGGQLGTLCRHIDDSARQVVFKMHRHVRELEKRNARLDDLRATVSALAACPAERNGRYAGYVNYLIASARGLFDRRDGTVGHRARPPAPRKHQLAAERRAAARPLARKRGGLAEARALRAKALAELGDWVHGVLLAGDDAVRLSDVRFEGEDQAALPARFIALARTRHLGGGKSLRAIEVRVEAVSGRVVVGGERHGLDAPDAVVVSARARTEEKP